jgi:hypothetical protein
MNYKFIPPDTDPLFQVVSIVHRLPMTSFWSRLLLDLSTRRPSRASLIRFSRQFVVIILIAVESKYMLFNGFIAEESHPVCMVCLRYPNIWNWTPM